MSRVGKQPVIYPAGVKVKVQGSQITIEGPKGTKLEWTCHPLIKVTHDEAAKAIKVERPDDERLSRALHGTTRNIIKNMVEGVTKGYEKRLKIEGVGYQAVKQGKSIVLKVGYANDIVLTPPDGVTADLPDPTTIVVRGADKQKVGQFAAELRAARKPEPYKGKGVRYENEVVRRKEGKSFASGG
jgi:large subunit ribosomal protein L6